LFLLNVLSNSSLSKAVPAPFRLMPSNASMAYDADRRPTNVPVHILVGTNNQMIGFLPASQLIDFAIAPGRIRTADPLVRREYLAFLSV
jgi:hypothetical protein